MSKRASACTCKCNRIGGSVRVCEYVCVSVLVRERFTFHARELFCRKDDKGLRNHVRAKVNILANLWQKKGSDNQSSDRLR